MPEPGRSVHEKWTSLAGTHFQRGGQVVPCVRDRLRGSGPNVHAQDTVRAEFYDGSLRFTHRRKHEPLPKTALGRCVLNMRRPKLSSCPEVRDVTPVRFRWLTVLRIWEADTFPRLVFTYGAVEVLRGVNCGISEHCDCGKASATEVVKQSSA